MQRVPHCLFFLFRLRYLFIYSYAKLIERVAIDFGFRDFAI